MIPLARIPYSDPYASPDLSKKDEYPRR